MEPSQGQPQMNIPEMARQGIRLELRKGLAQVRETGDRVICRGLRVKTETGILPVNLALEPLPGGR